MSLVSNSGVTLVELLLAVLLVTLLAMAAVASELAGERILRLTRNRSEVQNEAQAVIEHMAARLLPANLVQSVALSNYVVRARVDYDTSWNPLTDSADDTTDDTYVWYGRNAATNRVEFAHTGSALPAPASQDVVGVNITAFAATVSNNEVQVDITAQKGTESVTLHSSIALRCMPSG